MRLPFSLSKSPLHNSWAKFTDHLLSRRLFGSPSNFRIRLCILLDFLKAEQSFYADTTIVPDPRHNLHITSEMVNYRFGEGCDEALDRFWDSDCFCDMDSVGYYGLDEAPFNFTLRSKSCRNVLRGIVYTEDEYVMHQNDLAHRSADRYPGDVFNELYREEFHVVQTLQSTWIIVFLSNYRAHDTVKNRCNMQIREFQCYDVGYTYDQQEAFRKRFGTI
jgi:hypothetical protein